MKNEIIIVLFFSASFLCAQSNYIVYMRPELPYSLVTSASMGRLAGLTSIKDPESHAMIWEGLSTNRIDLHPSGWEFSEVEDICGNQQIGVGAKKYGDSHAVLWHGSAESVVDLNPKGFERSEGRGVYGGKQVGYGRLAIGGSTPHALLWNSSPDDYVDLHDKSFENIGGSMATCIAGDFQGGSVGGRAVRWMGTPESGEIIHPGYPHYELPYKQSKVNGITSEGRAVGLASLSEHFVDTGTIDVAHAFYWPSGLSNSVDLHPSWARSSTATAISRDIQVGQVLHPSWGQYHACLWRGTAESYFDLHKFLPSTFPTNSSSEASAIDEFGNICGRAIAADSTNFFTVVWIPIYGDGDQPRLTIATAPPIDNFAVVQVFFKAGSRVLLQESKSLTTWNDLEQVEMKHPVEFKLLSNINTDDKLFIRGVRWLP